MYLITWLVVGFFAGLLAAPLLGGAGFGRFADIAIGMAGAVFGGWFFGVLGVHLHLDPGPAAIAFALIGSGSILLLVRTLHPRRVVV